MSELNEVIWTEWFVNVAVYGIYAMFALSFVAVLTSIGTEPLDAENPHTAFKFMVFLLIFVINTGVGFMWYTVSEINIKERQDILNELQSGSSILRCQQDGDFYLEMNIPISLSNGVFTFEDDSFVNADVCQTESYGYY